ncbi:coatomer protein subunit gamma [Thalassiosira pseudonana CCMP1335]|uniref:Coatomer subunit gamma n=1 Tax=Thalassiosira pseudonana TaxID=35128 RepID=B8CB37_THAPS|nr:coatomer protein subunit gamma [Thalassiosira pseudonana CCMP1335]EED89061.1 coatomer protein subunit gamma [Thalassiosira pseudonana CCMP1335]
MGDQQDDGLNVNTLMKEVTSALDKFKLEDDEPGHSGGNYYSPYANLEKAAVLQEARCFHDPTAVRESPRKCCTVIAQLLHLTNTGQYLNSAEATEVFFGVTKLFMSDDASLRRMVYLFIKDVAETCDPDDVIIVTSSLTKDMTCDVDLYRANALRVLARIIDGAMLGAIERYVKQAVVDSSGQVSSAALVSATHLFERNEESKAIVKRWIGETQEATSSPNEMVQFHAMQLLYQIKKHDRLGMQKLVTQFSQRNSLKSPLALVLLVRYTAKLLHDENGSTFARSGYAFLEASLRHKNEMVVYEAARAICALPNIEPQELSPAVNVMQLFLSSPKPAVRFAAIKTVSQVAVHHPRIVSKCNEDLEALIGDANRSIATLAITTLLKTGSENSVDRLLKQISVFLSEIPDEYKITIVKSLQRLCLTYPSKHRVLVGFLSNFLREEGGFDFKRSIVNSIVSLIKAVPETTESSLLHLCEFIEDCEFTMLSTQILHLLRELGPGTQSPARYIRFIYNRVILENSAVRAAAVAALSKFAARCPSLRTSILTLLKRSLDDEDDETRDRASVAVSVLRKACDETTAFVLLQGLPMSFDRLDRSIRAYIRAPAAMESAEQLTLSALPVVEESAEPEPSADEIDDEKKEVVDPAAAVYAIPELASLGRVFRSSNPTELSEEETEYVVRCIKHVMPEHIILQFLIQNTVEDQRLVNCSVTIEGDSECFEVAGEIAAESIKYGETANAFTVINRNTEAPLAPCNFECVLRFGVIQVDPKSGEDESDPFDEEYPLEELELATSDFMAKVSVPDFRKGWEEVGNANEVLEKFALQFKKQEDAVAAVIDFLGMQPCDGTGHIKPGEGGKKPHMLHLSGVFVGGMNVLARAQVAASGDAAGVLLKIAVRSDDPDVSRMVADCIR